MRRRFIADEISDDRAALTGAHAAHLARVLRARPGQEFDIVGEGRVRHGRVIDVADDRVTFLLGDDVAETEPRPGACAPPVSLWLAVFKFDRMEWAIEKCTELGAARIIPLIAARTDAHLASAAAKRVERWRRIAREASEQSRRALAPEISAPVKLKREIIEVPGTRLLLSESEDRTGLRAALDEAPPAGAIEFAAPSAGSSVIADSAITPEHIHLAIGPEGGWTEAEKKLFADCGWIAVSLGPTVLRAETAAIAALAVVMSEIV
jgi:16S rRNA (uracil1498-N3)-methyltransferase